MCFSKNSIIEPSQLGFRDGHNTTNAVLEFIDNIYTSFENVSCDTVNHDILVSKLACYGLRGMAGDWSKIEGNMLRLANLGQVLEILKLVYRRDLFWEQFSLLSTLMTCTMTSLFI